MKKYKYEVNKHRNPVEFEYWEPFSGTVIVEGRNNEGRDIMKDFTWSCIRKDLPMLLCREAPKKCAKYQLFLRACSVNCDSLSPKGRDA